MMYEKVKKFVERYDLIQNNDRLLVLFSMGRDSSVLLHILNILKPNYNLKLEVLNIEFPHHIYKKSRHIFEYWMDRSLNIVHLVPGMSDDVLARGNPCKKCKEARRRELLRVLSSYKEWKMVTAHTISDLIAYTISLLLHSNFNLSNLQPDHRVIEVLSRFYPSLKLESMQIIRPLLNLSERDVSRILSETGIPTIEKCMYSSWRPKRVFFKYLDLFPHTLTYSELINFLQKHDLPNKFENLIKKIPWTETVL